MDDDGYHGEITDEELTTLALRADPHPAIDARATPWGVSPVDAGLLPGWYMPPVAGSRRGTAVKVAVGVIIASFVLINALGLCVTYGWVTLA